MAVPVADIVGAPSAMEIFQSRGDQEHLVYASSRNGALVERVRTLWSRVSAVELYLLKDVAFLFPHELSAEAEKIESLIEKIDSNPGLVLEATKSRYQPDIELLSSGFEPLPARMVYPTDSVVVDGWVYYYSEDQVRSLLRCAIASRAPAIASDPDGESLEYAFAFLKAHRALLCDAKKARLAVVYAETNPV